MVHAWTKRTLASVLAIAAIVAAQGAFAAENDKSGSKRRETAPAITETYQWKNPGVLGAGIREGGFSGLIHLPKDPKDVFYTVADRGPNGEIEKDGTTLRTFPAADFEPRIYKIKLSGGEIRILQTIKLHYPKGVTNAVTGKNTLTGLPNIEGADEVPYDAAGTAQLSYDKDGLDLEGIAYNPKDNTFWLSDEYRPSIVHVRADGTVIGRYVPKGDKERLAGSRIPVKEIFPAVYAKRVGNRGFEGITISPDGKTMYVSIQSPLANPDKKTSDTSRSLRILQIDLKSVSVTGEYVYEAESAKGLEGVKQKDIVISDIHALRPGVLLVDERDKNSGDSARLKRIYKIDLKRATNVLGSSHNGMLESMTPQDLRAAGITPAPKTLLADLVKLGYPYEKIEGLAVRDSHSIVIANDNDFGIGYDSEGKLIETGVPTRVDVIRLPHGLN
jgi:hypothetical protein